MFFDLVQWSQRSLLLLARQDEPPTMTTSWSAASKGCSMLRATDPGLEGESLRGLARIHLVAGGVSLVGWPGSICWQARRTEGRARCLGTVADASRLFLDRTAA